VKKLCNNSYLAVFYSKDLLTPHPTSERGGPPSVGSPRLPLTLKEEDRLRVFGKRALRRIFRTMREAGEDCIMRNFII
jgi:hypothetical protein